MFHLQGLYLRADLSNFVESASLCAFGLTFNPSNYIRTFSHVLQRTAPITYQVSNCIIMIAKFHSAPGHSMETTLTINIPPVNSVRGVRSEREREKERLKDVEWERHKEVKEQEKDKERKLKEKERERERERDKEQERERLMLEQDRALKVCLQNRFPMEFS